MISLGFSPCPNDTFIFYAAANKKIPLHGLVLDFIIEDVETLNSLAIKRALDITKISCHAFYYLQDDYKFLRCGGAFGRGCGPLLVARENFKFEISNLKSQKSTIAIPGGLTTAFLLLKLYLSSILHSSNQMPRFISMPFYEIMSAVKEGRADAGLIIHEGRFTYHEYGLSKAADLGQWWENETGLPIPLGGIIAKKSLGKSKLKKIEDLITRSIEYAMLHKDEALPYIKRYAQELSGDVINKHIALYVNNYTLDIGDDGEAALNELLKRTKGEKICLHR